MSEGSFLLRFKRRLESWLLLPEWRGATATAFDTVEAAQQQRRIYQNKPALQTLYREYCRPFVESARRAPQGARMLEIGSGGSPLSDFVPGILSSDVIRMPWLNVVCSAYALPFPDASLDRIFLLFVTHHLGRMEAFLNECRRCLKPEGEVVIIDPAITRFSVFYYRYFHVDAMDIHAQEWRFSEHGRLSSSNIALPWIVFHRDGERFKRLYPELKLVDQGYNTCLAFLLTGGLRYRALAPAWFIAGWFRMENWLIRHVSQELAVTMWLVLRKPPRGIPNEGWRS